MLVKHNNFRIGILVLIFSLFCSLEVNSQVTIGSTLPPNKGSLLDLKENDNAGINAAKGLLLPRVVLIHPELMNPVLNHSSASDEDKAAHVGTAVFNVTDDHRVDLCKGIYVWNNIKWERIDDPCCFPAEEVAIYYPQNFNFMENEEAEFEAIVTEPFNMLDPNLYYKWYIGDNEAADVEIPNTNGSNAISVPLTMMHNGKQISVKVFNKCSEIASERHTMIVTSVCQPVEGVVIKSRPERTGFNFGVDAEAWFYADILGDPTSDDLTYKWEWTVNGVKKESSDDHIIEKMTAAHNGVELKLTISNGCPSSVVAMQDLSVYTCPEEKLKFDVYPNQDMSPTYTFTINDLMGHTKEELADLGITIQWYKKQNKMSGSWTEWINDRQFIPIPGANDPQYVFNAVDYLGGASDICDIGVKVTGNMLTLTDCPIKSGYSYYRVMAQGSTGSFQATKPQFNTSNTPW